MRGGITIKSGNKIKQQCLLKAKRMTEAKILCFIVTVARSIKCMLEKGKENG